MSTRRNLGRRLLGVAAGVLVLMGAVYVALTAIPKPAALHSNK